jgi:hypothetical protein
VRKFSKRILSKEKSLTAPLHDEAEVQGIIVREGNHELRKSIESQRIIDDRIAISLHHIH